MAAELQPVASPNATVQLQALQSSERSEHSLVRLSVATVCYAARGDHGQDARRNGRIRGMVRAVGACSAT
jgi:hypothetical protein